MEGDMKEIVLQRLEHRLKEKDEEIHSLKKELQGPDDEARVLREKVDSLEMEVKETQVTLSEVMKKVGALEAALDSVLMLMAEGGEEDYPQEDLSVPGSMPMDPQSFEKFAASPDQKDIKEDEHKDIDALRFFHLNKNS